LHIDAFSDEEIQSENKKIYENNYVNKDTSKLLIANSIWQKENYKFMDAFISNAAENYYAEIFEVDFSDENVVKQMNDWVLDHTNNKIDPQYQPDPLTILVLMNAVYLFDEWELPFDKAATINRDFTLNSGEIIRVKTMQQMLDHHGYLEKESFKKITLNLQNVGAVEIILPNEGYDVKDIIADETYEPKIIDTQHVGYIDYYDNNHVIFHANSQLYTMDLSTGIKEPFMEDTKTLWIPVYSPDKKWVAFNKEGSFGTGDIFIKNLDSDEVFQMTNAKKADWGPDFRPTPTQQKVYFDSNRDGDRDIYVYDTYTHELTNLTNNDVDDGIPYLSPDRSEILFYSNRDGDDEIYTMNIDGTNITQLTFNDSEDRAAAWSH
ncbi:serpin family protein, partial [Sphaerochaeta sp. S2]|uniref:serpin family protein n=1 Tax=Sphaerochaeta sp. S2 TaxID=2798868 RepID=UPI0018E9523D